jgi:hypothetical protein
MGIGRNQPDMRLSVILFCVGVVLSSPHGGHAQTGTRHALGAGSVETCGKWTEDRSHRASGTWLYAGSWALGFLSSAAVFSDYDLLDRLDSDAVFGWLDNYCLTHPLTPFASAIVEFVHARTK